MFDKNYRASSLKLSVLYENDTIIRPDSKQSMLLQDQMEPYVNGSNRAREGPTIWKKAMFFIDQYLFLRK